MMTAARFPAQGHHLARRHILDAVSYGFDVERFVDCEVLFGGRSDGVAQGRVDEFLQGEVGVALGAPSASDSDISRPL